MLNKKGLHCTLVKIGFWIISLLFGFAANLFGQVSHTINFTYEKLNLSEISGADKANHLNINYGNLQKVGEIGNPALPIKYVNLIIPSNQDVSNIKISTSNGNIIDIYEPVFPIQRDIPTSTGFQSFEFKKPNSEVYNSDGPYPAKIVQMIHDGYFDGSNHIITLAVYPMQYNPTKSQLVFYSSISFTLESTQGPSKPLIVKNRTSSAQTIYDKILEQMVDNPQDIPSFQVKPLSNVVMQKSLSQLNFYEYVVITTNALKAGFDKFLEWKRRKGIDIGIVTVEEIYANYTGDLISGIYDNAGKIRQYLSDAYQEGTVWTLFGGDVPLRYGCGSNNTWYSDGKINENKIPADLYFADFNGDWNVDNDEFYGENNNNDAPDYNPEIFVGRILATNIQEILNWVDKLIIYEQMERWPAAAVHKRNGGVRSAGKDISENVKTRVRMLKA